MRLIGFGPGEICDRLSILNLKIQHAAETQKSLKHFTDERTQLAAELRKAVGQLRDLVPELAKRNLRIWEATDRVRELRPLPWSLGRERELADLCVELQELNDQRAELIREINIACGHDAPQEKV